MKSAFQGLHRPPKSHCADVAWFKRLFYLANIVILNVILHLLKTNVLLVHVSAYFSKVHGYHWTSDYVENS